ncbi:MAG: AAA family ATPase [Treponema sp.]|nr:AAA family ATPase [Treponema sp.]
MKQSKDGVEQLGEFCPYSKIDKVLAFAFDRIEEVFKTKKSVTGIPSGFYALDDITTGFQPSDFVIIASRPSVGKTTLALNMAAHIAFREHRPVAFFSMETWDAVLAQRLISSEAMVDGKKMRNGFLAAEDFRRILDVTRAMVEAPFFFVDEPNIKFHELCSRIRELRAREGVEIVFIDRLERIDFGNGSLPRHEQISEISRSLKTLAYELRIPIVVLCGLRQETDRSYPTLAGLGDSGPIEQDADLVMFLNRKPSPKRKKSGEGESAEDGIPTELVITKQRNGPLGVIDLVLRSKYTRFVPLE